MTIPTIEAGRELDALIAEKVMGLTLGPAPMSANFEITCVKLGDHKWRNISYYSTDIGAAWEVVENLGESNFALARGQEHWTAGFSTTNGMAGENADTAPEAICLAALKTVEVDT